MVNQATTTALFDASMRIELLIHLGTQMLDESLPSVVEEAFRSDLDEIQEALGLPDNYLDENGLSDLPWDLRNSFKKQGYLAQFATPVPCNFNKEGTGYTFSWGTYKVKWIYGETTQDCCDQALAWHDQYINSEFEAQQELAPQLLIKL